MAEFGSSSGSYCRTLSAYVGRQRVADMVTSDSDVAARWIDAIRAAHPGCRITMAGVPIAQPRQHQR